MPKTMIFLFDGSGNDATQVEGEATYTNVYAINNLIASDAVENGSLRSQVTFYLAGVGTQFSVGEQSSLFGFFHRKRDLIFGDSLNQVILRAYINLCSNFRPGDKLVLIGFSRGAAAARIFSRLLSDFGILLSDQLLWLSDIWDDFESLSLETDDQKYYSSIEMFHENRKRKNDGRDVFHKLGDVKFIKFLGVFDTVVGPVDRLSLGFRDQVPASAVEHIVHLLSMHETRYSFQVKRFERGSGNNPPKTLREIWVPGVHSDVGGGYNNRFLAVVSLLTMAKFLEDLAGVELSKGALNDQKELMRDLYTKRAIYINKEPFMDDPTPRRPLNFDEAHPLHFRLTREMDVFWKAEPPLTRYLDKFTSLKLVKQHDLAAMFDHIFT